MPIVLVVVVLVVGCGSRLSAPIEGQRVKQPFDFAQATEKTADDEDDDDDETRDWIDLRYSEIL